jgi:outer membrane immunogenic protein
MKHFLRAAAVATILFSHSVFAADLSVPYKAPPSFTPPPAATWAGLYLGANGGGGVIRANISDEDCAAECNSVHIAKGFGELGGQLGYNWQWGFAVFGLEGDLNWAAIDEHYVMCLDCSLGIAGTFKLDAFGSVRARLGLAFDRVLLYVMGGPAFGHVHAIGNLIHPHAGGFVTDTVSEDTWHAGVAAGAGAAVRIDQNWSFFGEFLYIDLLQKDPVWRVFAPERLGLGASMEVVRIGFNYQLWK